MTNTTEKGNRFEEKVFDLFTALLSSGDYYLSSKHSKIFRKKGYYSEARKGNIIVDISIESYVGDSENYSFLTVIECKDYSKKIPVDDIEEFSSKLNQIGQHNTKGIFVTNSPFQTGALNFAQSMKIGLVRINDSKSFEWVNHRKDRKYKYLENTITHDLLSTESNTDCQFVGLFGKIGFDSISQMLIEMELIDRFYNNSSFIQFPYLSTETIIQAVKNLPNSIYENRKLDSEKLCIYLKELYGVRFEFNTEINAQLGILGKITFNPLVISISNQLKSINEARWRFTLAHEIGHLILHSERLKLYLDENTENENSILRNQGVSSIQNSRLEIQANIFASHLLLPQTDFIKVVNEYFKQERIYKGYLYLDNQPCNISLVMRLLNEFQNKFGVSNQFAKYRLIENEFLKDNLDSSLGSIIKRELLN